MKDVVAIVLAAGEGTRMISSIPKVLHKICGKPMIMHVIDTIYEAGIKDLFIITGYKEPEVREIVKKYGTCITQEKRLGTAHAVKQAEPYLKGFKGDIIVMCGDTPLITSKTLKKIIRRRRTHHSACTVLTTILDDPTGYGRIVRNRDQTVRKIVEEKDTNIYEAEIKEINTGTYCFYAPDLFEVLPQIKNDNAQKEYYLTDAIYLFYKQGKEVEAVITEDAGEAIGVNSRQDLARAEKIMRKRILDEIMNNGVTVLSPDTTFVDKTVSIGKDTVIYPFSIIEGDSEIGQRCQIGPAAHIVSSKIEDNVKIIRSTVYKSKIKGNQQIGPFAYIYNSSDIKSYYDDLFPSIQDSEEN